MSRRRQMGDVSRRVKQKTGAINADIESSLSGMRTAKAFANEELEEEKFHASNETFKTSKRMFHKEMGIFMALMEFFVSILSVAVITVGGLLIMKKQLNYIDLITFTLYITTFVNPIRKLANFSELFANGTAGLQRFAEIMSTFSSSMPVSAAKASACSSPASSRDFSLVPSPCRIVAFGSSSESSSQRARSDSRILTDRPASISCLAR